MYVSSFDSINVRTTPPPHTHTPMNFTGTLTKKKKKTMSAISHVIQTGMELKVKGCGTGPWLVLVSTCFRENVVATCKIGSFLCSLDNLLQKNVIILSFGNQISKWRSFEKRAIFDLLFTFSSHQGKVTKISSAHISNTYIHVFCSPYWLFSPYQFWKKNTNLSGTVSLWYESWCWFLFAPFWNNQ